jgi:hypothetical protein
MGLGHPFLQAVFRFASDELEGLGASAQFASNPFLSACGA